MVQSYGEFYILRIERRSCTTSFGSFFFLQPCANFFVGSSHKTRTNFIWSFHHLVSFIGEQRGKDTRKRQQTEEDE
jgi:hypothetical protein